MAKSDTPLTEIDLSRAYTPPRQPAWARDKPINAFDTEASDGMIFMLSVAWDNKESFVYEIGGNELPRSTIWKALTHKNARSALNVWYNLNFDANVILRNVLSKDQISEVVISGHTETEEYDITFIKSKFLQIRDKQQKQTYTHYDIAQFFHTSLEKAVNEWIGETKFNDEIETGLFGSNTPHQLIKLIEQSEILSWNDLPVSKGQEWTLTHAHNYIHEYYSIIKTYARKDAEITRDLWKEAVQVGEQLEIPMGQPFSTGYLAESYLNAHLREKPGIGKFEIAKLAWNAYHGGRFEVIKRGNFDNVIGPDINSAYPYFLRDLPDPKTLVWVNNQNPTIEELEKADYGFVNCRITTDKNRLIQPFAVKDDSQDKLVYPALEDYELTCIKDIFVHAYNQDYLVDFEILDCWLGYETSGTYFPFGFINGKYKERQDAKQNNKFQQELWLKIVLNSMYGKTCQTTPKREKVTEKTTLDEKQKFVSELSLPPDLRETYHNGFIETLVAGSWFNPFLASYITGLTRLELHKRITEYGLEENTIMLATDCLMIEKDAFDQTSFEKDLMGDSLGQWDLDYAGKAFVIGAGVYQVDKLDGKKKIQTRGFREADLNNGLRHEAEQNTNEIMIESDRPYTIGEAIWSNVELNDVGNFTGHERAITPNMDSSRQWNETDFDQLLNGIEVSKPLVVTGKTHG